MAKICKDEGCRQPGTQQDDKERQDDTTKKTLLSSARVLLRSGNMTSTEWWQRDLSRVAAAAANLGDGRGGGES
jgi:hypothetical protein